jgi:hypothetical protein
VEDGRERGSNGEEMRVWVSAKVKEEGIKWESAEVYLFCGEKNQQLLRQE